MNWFKIPLLNPGDESKIYSLTLSFGTHTKPPIYNVEFNNSKWKYVLISLQIGRIRRNEMLSTHISLILRFLVPSDPL